MYREFAVRPVIGGPPQSRPSPLSDTEHLLDLGLAAVGQHHALRLKRLAVGKEDRLAQVMMLDLAFFAPIPLPTQLLHLPLLQTQGKGKEVLEPIEPHDLRHLLPDGLLSAGTPALHGLLDGGMQLEQLLVGLALQQVQRTHLRAIKAGAEAAQQFPPYAPQLLVGLAIHLAPAAIG